MKTALVTLMLLFFAVLSLSLANPRQAVAAVSSPAGPQELTLADANLLLGPLGVKVLEVADAPVQGMWELVLERGGERTVAYLDHERKHLLPGPVFDLASRGLVGKEMNRPPQVQALKTDVASLPTDDSLVLGNPNGKVRIFVFTDPDCPYCAKMHTELVRLAKLEPDLAIYLKLFPLKMHPDAFEKARVILGEHSLQLLEKAFAGERLPAPGPGDPAGPVEETIRLAGRIGIDSTPTLVLPDGRILPGVKSAPEMSRLLAGDTGTTR